MIWGPALDDTGQSQLNSSVPGHGLLRPPNPCRKLFLGRSTTGLRDAYFQAVPPRIDASVARTCWISPGISTQGQQLCLQPQEWKCLALSCDSKAAGIAYLGATVGVPLSLPVLWPATPTLTLLPVIRTFRRQRGSDRVRTRIPSRVPSRIPCRCDGIPRSPCAQDSRVRLEMESFRCGKVPGGS